MHAWHDVESPSSQHLMQFASPLGRCRPWSKHPLALGWRRSELGRWLDSGRSMDLCVASGTGEAEALKFQTAEASRFSVIEWAVVSGSR